ncbi:MAG: SsrA-binding protein SmpB [Magnetospirillum gryphiswaldense]|uniref:SsrA-binding protein SmpB n=1 Tax=Magnetospirillum sp. 64-120 TaxID=1895778 RepID=UPI000927CFB0|nr:SsrA-binding protein SmpB [Magnetospirillum sp. 64-120]MBI2241376.1 SsrA-binding protein SmpB [Magnetospirillum gryphiswaldense]OJX81127.1 MAG: SsrA-binding protein [Magnetospirillum sp. 64-120]
MSLPARIAAQNRKARHEYTIVDTIEAGIMLVGTEVKSLRAGKGNINEAFAGPNGDELILYNAYIPEYQAKMPFPHETRRPRKLLLHRRELRKLVGAIAKEGMTLVPLDIHFNDRGIAKVQLGLAKGRKAHDKREAIKQRDWNREKARVLRNRD